MATNTAKRLVKRQQRLAFMNTGTDAAPAYTRMTGFTSLTNSKNAKEYSRQYIDKESEDTDVTGYAPSTSYSFDRYTNTPVHAKIAEIHDDELTGTEATVDIVVVDLFDEVADKAGTYVARKRSWAVVPDGDGDGTDALVYTGTFKTKSDVTKGYATVTDDNQTITFSETLK
jgi:hypothetical protein